MASFDRVADVYDATRSLRADVMSLAVDALVTRMRGSSVLDFGVGTGRFAGPLARAGLRVVGVDVSLKMIRQALAKGVRGLVLSDAASVPFRDMSFDYVLSVHFMHLVGDWRAAVREMARVGRNGLLSLMEDWQGAWPRDLYIELREKKGLPMGALKLGERDLVKLVRPAVVEEVARYTEVFDPKALLAEYSSKLHSVTWEVPDGVNAQIVDEMTERLGVKRELSRTLTLAAWTRDQLLGLDPLA
ncbi:MAG: methyltransferase domain-containing protein [Nitrososphaerales archaeon]|nr:methyltransferase domain-containing protein [Nitrososphaerales archaeon]